MRIAELLQTKRNEILEIARRHGARNIRVFGSIAREEEAPDSDIDLLVEFEADRDLFDHVALIDDLETLLDRKVDVVTEDSLHWYIRDRVLKEAIAL